MKFHRFTGGALMVSRPPSLSAASNTPPPPFPNRTSPPVREEKKGTVLGSGRRPSEQVETAGEVAPVGFLQGGNKGDSKEVAASLIGWGVRHTSSSVITMRGELSYQVIRGGPVPNAVTTGMEGQSGKWGFLNKTRALSLSRPSGFLGAYAELNVLAVCCGTQPDWSCRLSS